MTAAGSSHAQARAAAETISAACLAARVRLLHRTITAVFDEALRPLGLTDAQLTILVTIANDGPVSPGVVARKLNMEKSTISRHIARMARHGWMTVSEGVSGRQHQLTLTRTGEALLVEAYPIWCEAQARATTLLGPRGADSIRRLGRRMWEQGSQA